MNPSFELSQEPIEDPKINSNYDSLKELNEKFKENFDLLVATYNESTMISERKSFNTTKQKFRKYKKAFKELKKSYLESKKVLIDPPKTSHEIEELNLGDESSEKNKEKDKEKQETLVLFQIEIDPLSNWIQLSRDLIVSIHSELFIGEARLLEIFLKKIEKSLEDLYLDACSLRETVENMDKLEKKISSYEKKNVPEMISSLKEKQKFLELEKEKRSLMIASEDEEDEVEKRHDIPGADFINEKIDDQIGKIVAIEDGIKEVCTKIEFLQFQIETHCKPEEKGRVLRRKMKELKQKSEKFCEDHFNSASSPRNRSKRSEETQLDSLKEFFKALKPKLEELKSENEILSKNYKFYQGAIDKKLPKIRELEAIQPAGFDIKENLQKEHDNLLKGLMSIERLDAWLTYQFERLYMLHAIVNETTCLTLNYSILQTMAEKGKAVRSPRKKSPDNKVKPDNQDSAKTLNHLISSFNSIKGVELCSLKVHSLVFFKILEYDNMAVFEFSFTDIKNLYNPDIMDTAESRNRITRHKIRNAYQDLKSVLIELEKLKDQHEKDACKAINKFAFGVRNGRYRREKGIGGMIDSLIRDEAAVQPHDKEDLAREAEEGKGSHSNEYVANREDREIFSPRNEVLSPRGEITTSRRVVTSPRKEMSSPRREVTSPRKDKEKDEKEKEK